MKHNRKEIPEYKVITVGDTAVGKTSIIMRFQHDVFLPEHQNSIGGSFITKRMETQAGPVNLNIWDTAGQERYRSLVPMYSRGAAVALIVFDLGAVDSFTEVPNWVDRVRAAAIQTCEVIIVGNKLDLEPAIQLDKVRDWAKAHGTACMFVSALNGSGIEELFQEVTRLLPTSPNAPTVELIPTTAAPDATCC
jgi:small GTP-binding protein